MIAYTRLFSDPAQSGPVEGGRFRVLIVTATLARLSNILRTVRALPATIKRRDIFQLASDRILDYERPCSLLEPAWVAVRPDRAVSQKQAAFPSFRSSRERQVNHQCAVQDSILDTENPGPGG